MNNRLIESPNRRLPDIHIGVIDIDYKTVTLHVLKPGVEWLVGFDGRTALYSVLAAVWAMLKSG